MESAVKKAEGNADKALKRLEVMIRQKPLNIGVRFDTKEFEEAECKIIAKARSIKAINKEMAELVEHWNSLTQAERITSKV